MGLVVFLYKIPFYEGIGVFFYRSSHFVNINICFLFRKKASVVVVGRRKERRRLNSFPFFSLFLYLIILLPFFFFTIGSSSIDFPLFYLTSYAKLEFDRSYKCP